MVLPYFSTVSYKLYDFRGKKMLNIKMCFNFLQNYSMNHVSFWKEFSEV